MILLALLAIVVSGAALVAAAIPEQVADRTDRALRVFLAAALGLGTWSALYAGSRMLQVSSPAKDCALVVLGSSLLLVARRGRRAGVPSAADPAPYWLWILFGAACAIAVAAFVEHNQRFPDGGWDAWVVWNLRARFLARASHLSTAFSPLLSFGTHADYPWLLPGVVAQGVVLAGRERMVSELIAGVFGALALGIVPLALARLHGARCGLLGALAIVSVPAFAIFVTNQQSDIPLSVFVSSAAALIALACARPQPPLRMLILAGFAAGLGAWTKNEGVLYAACLTAGLLWRSRDLHATMAFATGALPAVLLLLGFKLTYAPPNDLAYFSTASTLIAHAVDPLRWGELGLRLLRRVMFFQAFGLWLIAALVVFAVSIRRLPSTAVGTALFLAVGALIVVYVAQPLPLDWLVRTSADRLILQLWPAAVLATFLRLARTTART
jgi:hypothetical protein